MLLAYWLGGFLFLAYIAVVRFMCVRFLVSAAWHSAQEKKKKRKIMVNDQNHTINTIISSSFSSLQSFYYHARKRIKSNSIIFVYSHQMNKWSHHQFAQYPQTPSPIQAVIKIVDLIAKARAYHITHRQTRIFFAHISATTCPP